MAACSRRFALVEKEVMDSIHAMRRRSDGDGGLEQSIHAERRKSAGELPLGAVNSRPPAGLEKPSMWSRRRLKTL
ncbi:unnamed protein product [Linum trigynum]|uniref:Uncharacterized protein n=1 Tax=Linum trigynum TaxID=586398 RepID=A0AAV2EMD5_9ROSI